MPSKILIPMLRRQVLLIELIYFRDSPSSFE